MQFSNHETGASAGRSDRHRTDANRDMCAEVGTRHIVNLEECGKVIGQVVDATGGRVFGPWRGAVYLTRK